MEFNNFNINNPPNNRGERRKTEYEGLNEKYVELKQNYNKIILSYAKLATRNKELNLLVDKLHGKVTKREKKIKLRVDIKKFFTNIVAYCKNWLTT